jgi:hypothetical protein
MREADEPGDERVVLKRQFMANAPQLGREDSFQLCWVRLVEKENLIKASPEGAIKKALVVGGGDKNALTAVAVEQLEKGIDDSAELAVLGGIFALLAYGIELVKKAHEAAGREEVENLAEVR